MPIIGLPPAKSRQIITVRFGSSAAPRHRIIRLAAIGCEAAVQIPRKPMERQAANGQKQTLPGFPTALSAVFIFCRRKSIHLPSPEILPDTRRV